MKLPRPADLRHRLHGAADAGGRLGSYIPNIYAMRYARHIEPIKSILTRGLLVGSEGSGAGMSDGDSATAFEGLHPFIEHKRSNGQRGVYGSVEIPIASPR